MRVFCAHKSFFFLALTLVYARFETPRIWHPSDTKVVASGAWGGEHVILQVSGNGAEAEFDCAHGQINERMALDPNNRFDVAGTFTPEHGGPILRDETAASLPARYSGNVHGDTMTLTVALKEENVGTFTLIHGSQPNLTKCR